MNRFAKFILMATTFAPAAFVYALVWVMSGCYVQAAIWFSVGGVMVALCRCVVRYALLNLQDVPYTATKVEIADNEVVSFLLVYLLPLITKDLATYNWSVWMLVALVLCYVVAKSYGYHFNPVLAMFNWHFYKVSDKEGMTYVLISKRRFYKSDTPIVVGELSDYILIEKQ